MTTSDIAAAARAFKDAIKGDVVDDSTIASRIKICKACPQRRKVTGFVSRVSKILGDLANRHRVPRYIADYKCNVCGCSLMLLVPATEKDLHKDSAKEAKKRPSTCWLKKK